MKIFCFFVVLLLAAITGNSQNFADSSKGKQDSLKPVKHSFLKAGLSYFSDNIYLGRKAADVQSIVMPSLEWYHKSGFYISAAAGYIPNTGYQQFDVKELAAGYEYSGDKLYASAAFAKYVFSDSSNAINAAISNALQFYAGYDLNFITVGAGVDLAFAGSTDIVFNPGISHYFSLSHDRFNITPAINVFAGTQNFYQAYYNPAAGHGHRVVKHGKGHGANGNSTAIVQVLSHNQFKILDCEIGVPFEYRYKHFALTAKPMYIIPLNAATLADGTTIVKESLVNSFLMEATISYQFSKHQ